jgi:hypothetical protein
VTLRFIEGSEQLEEVPPPTPWRRFWLRLWAKRAWLTRPRKLWRFRRYCRSLHREVEAETAGMTPEQKYRYHLKRLERLV